MKNLKYIFLTLLLIQIFGMPFIARADAELKSDVETTAKAKVLEVIEENNEIIPGINTNQKTQIIKVEIISGKEKGKVLEIDNDYYQLKKGDKFYIIHIKDAGETREIYAVSEPDRMPILIGLTILFLILVIYFGGIQGIRGLVSLAGGFFLIIYILLPKIVAGASPLLISILVSSLIILVGSYITHGFNKTTTSAVFGMVVTVMITGILAFLTVKLAHLSGFNSEEALYLNWNTEGRIDLIGLLLGAIMIGLLGVLYDVAIGQAISVEELLRAGPHLSKKIIYERAIRIGREHIGALVNTLAIAYVGAALPLLLLFYSNGETDTIQIINREIFATEIVRILVGSIGIILAVPITTFFATWMLVKKKKELVSKEILDQEKKALEHLGHTH